MKTLNTSKNINGSYSAFVIFTQNNNYVKHIRRLVKFEAMGGKINTNGDKFRHKVEKPRNKETNLAVLLPFGIFSN